MGLRKWIYSSVHSGCVLAHSVLRWIIIHSRYVCPHSGCVCCVIGGILAKHGVLTVVFQ